MCSAPGKRRAAGGIPDWIAAYIILPWHLWVWYGDRQILAKQLNISPHQLSYVTHSGEGEGLLFYGNTILPFIDHFPKDTELYRVMTTKPQEVASG